VTLGEFKAWLGEKGFGLSSDQGNATLSPWYAYRRSEFPARRCECNDDKQGMQLVIYVYSYDVPNGPHESVTARLRGEESNLWWSIEAYSMSVDEAVSRLDDVERKLIAAWNALGDNP
jgi:hypothetical protein